LQLSLSEIAGIVDGKVVGDDLMVVNGINSLDAARPGEISFFSDTRYKESLADTKASAIIVLKETNLFDGPQVVVANPVLAYSKVAGLFAASVPMHPGISDQAIVHESSSIGKDVSIYPMAYVAEEAVIGDSVILFPGVFIGNRVKIGKRTVIFPNVTILHDCLIGNDVIIHAGTVIGADGFGFTRDGPDIVRIPQIGFVQIDDEVEIGANNCIDRAAMGRTWIQRGVKTDNLVQIGHNVVIGEDTLVVAQAGISGSVNIGREVVIGPQVGLKDHIDIGDRVMIGGQSGVAKSISPGQVVTGYPAIPHRLWLKTAGLVSRLPEINERLRHFEKRVAEMEERLEKGKY